MLRRLRNLGYLLYVIALAFGCSGTVALSSDLQIVESRDRDRAIEYYREIYPLSQEIRLITEEWTTWGREASQSEYELNLYQKSVEFEDRLRQIHNKVVVIYTPTELRILDDHLVAAINKGILGFEYGQEYALTTREDYCLEAETNQLEFNRLMGMAADDWDDGLARYKIALSDIN